MSDRENPNSVEAWRTRITESEAFMKTFYPWWDAALELYQPKVSEDPKRRGEQVNTGRAFTLVEQKVPQLFYQAPELVLKPSPLLEGGYPNPQNPQQMIPYTGILQSHQDILNEKLGPDHIDAVRLWKRGIRDQVGVSGFSISVMGYESVTVDVDMPLQPGAVLNLAQPVKAPVPIFQRCFWERLSPKKLLIPAGTTDSDADKWPWIGYKFCLPIQTAITRWKLDPDFRGKVSRDENVLDHGFTKESTADFVDGVTVWFRAALFDPAVKHPEAIYTLTLIEGLEDFAEPPTQKYQTFDAYGRLTPDSLQGYPVIVQVARDVPDSPIPLSDVAVMTPLVNELNKFREQMILQRDANIPLRGYDAARVTPDILAKITAGQHGGLIGFDGPISDDMFKELAQTRQPRDNYTANDYVDNDLARITAIDANQSGVQSDTSKTATEAQLMQGSTNVRLDDERARQLAGYVQAVTKYSVLLQKYLTVEEAAQIVGPQRAQAWASVMKTLPAALAFTAKPDSAIRADAALERKKALDWLNFSAQSPYVNQIENWRQAAKWYGLNPDTLVTQPPEKGPEPAKGSVTFKGDDFVLPQAPVMAELAAQCGLKISPQALQAASMFGMLYAQMQAQQAAQQQAQAQPAEHGGAAPKADLISKHTADETGGMQGSGQPAPLAPGGQVM